jgi:hypothetical protein
MLPVGDANSPPAAVCMGTRVVTPVDPAEAAAEAAAVAVAAEAVTPAEALTAAVAEPVPAAVELELLGLQPTMSTPAMARPAPASNVRRVAILGM